MVKQPIAGRVKTRLGREIGTVRATGFYRATSSRILRRLENDPRWETWLAIDPATALGWPSWSASPLRVAQGRGDLGQRMQRIMDQLPPGPVLIIGTDIPQITATEIADAFRRLDRADAVFGPALDGGYWCVGLRRHPRIPRIFKNIRWSSAHALSDTLANLKGQSVALTTGLQDVDDAVSFRRLNGAGSCVVRPSSHRPVAAGQRKS